MQASLLRIGFGVVVLLALACGGGGSSGGSGPAAITQNTSLAIASAVVRGVLLANDIGPVVESSIRSDAGAALLAPQLPGRDVPAFAPRAAFGPTPVDCDVTGSVVLSGDVATPGAYAVGDQVVADYTMCDDGEDFLFDGLIDTTVLALAGALPGNDFDASLDVLLTDFLADDGATDFVYDGDVIFDYDLSQDPLEILDLMGTSLAIEVGADSFDLADYDHGLVLDAAPSPDEYSFFADGRMRSSAFDGEVTYDTTLDFEGQDGSPPSTGELVITGAFDATITVDPLGGDDVDLLVDLDGSGNVDVLIETTWTELGF